MRIPLAPVLTAATVACVALGSAAFVPASASTPQAPQAPQTAQAAQTAQPRTAHAPRTPQVRLLGEQIVPKGMVVDGAPVGELSGLDFDRRTGHWYAIADDTEDGPARFYTLALDLDANGLHGVRIDAMTHILRRDGSDFPPLSSPGAREVADPESIRYDPATRTLWWSSEGKRVVPDDGSAPQLVDPWVRQMTLDGRYVRQIAQPRTFRMNASERGPRGNETFEGLTLSTDGRQLVTSMEGPLFQDGPDSTAQHGALNRITFYDKLLGIPVRQVAYPLDALPGNGISELLAVDRDHYLTVERNFVAGVGNSIRVYDVDVRGATNVLFRDTLAGDRQLRPARKSLLVDLSTLGLPKVDNIEAVSWGPTLPNGERTLVFVSDDNLNPTQITQVVAVAVRL